MQGGTYTFPLPLHSFHSTPVAGVRRTVREMVDAVRAAEQKSNDVQVEEKALGKVHYGITSGEKRNLAFHPSIFVVEDISEEKEFTENNLRIIRPGYGLPPKRYAEILGKKAAKAIERGTPLTREDIH